MRERRRRSTPPRPRYCRSALAERQLRILRACRERGIQRREQMALPPREWHRLPPCVARGCNEGISAEMHKAEPTSLRAKPAARRLCSGRKRHGLSLIEQKSRRPRRRHTRGFCLFGAHSAEICEAFVSNSLSRLIGVRPAVEKRRWHDLTSAHIRCKCGKSFKYRTNIEEDSITYNCLSCGAPVDLVYNKKARAYQTVR